MQFSKTKTAVNLARAFAGECQAGMRYQLIAKLAVKEEYPVLADTVRTVAKNETYHAKSFYDLLVQKNGNADDIVIDAGYPFRFGTLEETLRFAADDEHAEFSRIYPAFAEEARKEGFEDVADLFERVAGVKKEHNILFNFLYESIRDGNLYKREKPTLWICSECGYRATTKEAWKICPLCKATQGYVQIPLPFGG